MIHLLNSAMMPAPGKYQLYPISQALFIATLADAATRGKLKSWIGYPQNQQIIRELSGIQVPLCREVTTIAHQDTLLIMKLPLFIDMAFD